MSRTVTSDRMAPGARLGDYRIEREVRSEETGLVYLAQHVVLPRRAALKVMHGGGVWLKEMAVAVVREACVLEPMDHPGVPRVYECGVLPDRRPWIALEALEGVTVAASLDAGHVMPVGDVIAMLRDVADILEYTHAQGVVHRNITSASVVRRSNAKFPFALRDWGEASTPDIELPDGLVDPRDDLHALGTIAYRALTGDLAGPGKTAAGKRAGAPQELAELIDQMMIEAREARPTAQSVRERAAMIWAMATLAPTTTGSIEKPRWTPAYGIGGDVTGPIPVERELERESGEQPVVSSTTTSDVSIRIR
jgi:serine/threonine protein kinase